MVDNGNVLNNVADRNRNEEAKIRTNKSSVACVDKELNAVGDAVAAVVTGDGNEDIEDETDSVINDVDSNGSPEVCDNEDGVDPDDNDGNDDKVNGSEFSDCNSDPEDGAIPILDASARDGAG